MRTLLISYWNNAIASLSDAKTLYQFLCAVIVKPMNGFFGNFKTIFGSTIKMTNKTPFEDQH